MAIPSGTIFSSTPAAISEKKSSLNNARTEGYSILDIKQAVSTLQEDDFHLDVIGLETITIESGGVGSISSEDADLFTIELNGADDNVTLALPVAMHNIGRVLTVVGGASLSATRIINIFPISGATISGAASFDLDGEFQLLRIVSNGVDWIKLN